MLTFRLNQIENEGNDPIETGESYGTPHDLANLYSNKRDKGIKDVPDGYNEDEPGRPKKKFGSSYGSEDSNFSRDPLGKKGLTGDDTPDRTNNVSNVSSLALENNTRMAKKLALNRLRKQVLLTEDHNSSLLDEKNILDE